MRLDHSQPGPGELASGAVIVAVFAIVLTGMVALAARQGAVDAWAGAGATESAQVPSETQVARASATPAPTPVADAPGEYTVRPGDSLFSVASDLGVSPNELIYWNRDGYPTLQSTPALRPGWVLRTTGPPLPTATPRPTAVPTPTPLLAGPSVPGVPVVTAASFPASDRVTVSWYAVSGGTPQQILESIEANGPWSDWAGGRATAHVQVQASFDFGFQTDAPGGCTVAVIGDPPISISYHVVLPAWTPPDAGASAGTVDWWAERLSETVTHESHHVTLYEQHGVAMQEIVATGTCASIPGDLQAVWDAALRANCEFDVAEYGAALGLSVESCVALGGS